MTSIVAWTVAILGIAYGMSRELTVRGLVVEVAAIATGCILIG